VLAIMRTEVTCRRCDPVDPDMLPDEPDPLLALVPLPLVLPVVPLPVEPLPDVPLPLIEPLPLATVPVTST